MKKKVLREYLYQSPPIGWDEEGIHRLLFKDMGKVPPRYFLYLNGLLRKIPPNEIATDLGIEEDSIRTELSSTVYKLIKEVLGIKRMQWYKFSEYLKEEGYYHPQPEELQEALGAISESAGSSESAELILAIQTSIVKVIDMGQDCTIPDADLQDFLIQADEYEVKGELNKALFLYSKIAVSAPLDFLCVLVKIALTYSKLKRYNDAILMAFFAQDYISDSKLKGSLYHVLAVAFDELCRDSPTLTKVYQALSFYQQSIQSSENRNAVAAWNKFDLLIYVMERDASFISQFKESAYLALINFQNSASNPNSNFKEHAQDILKDAQQIIGRRKLEDERIVALLYEIFDQL